MKNYIFIVIFSATVLLYSQDKHKQHEEKEKENSDTSIQVNKKMDIQDEIHSDMKLNRHGSGTGWLPDNSPMYGYMISPKTSQGESNEWMFMIHGNLFLRYNNQDITKEGKRGDEKLDAPNWVMGVARKKIGHPGLLRLTAMISFDPATIGGEGYPLLFQSGETWKGKPLVDRQHPHDLFSEISFEYTHSLSSALNIVGYFGYPGEPAFGPVAFMHRPSALNNPDAPLGHHWQDATHITFGVATFGLQFHNYKIEASLFTGREPNENRYNFDKPKFDSYSFRIAANPTEEFALQVSHAFTISPESINPDENIRKTTASIIYNKYLTKENILSTSLIWGYNDVLNEHKTNTLNLESNLKLHKANLYGRFDWVQKAGEELDLPEALHEEVYLITAFTLGANYSFFRFANTHLILGLQGSVFIPDDVLNTYYGNNPFSLEVYLRVTPSIMMH